MTALLLIVLSVLGQSGALPATKSDGTHRGGSLPAEALPARRAARPIINPGGSEDAWRYVFHRGRWWYWSASERWSYFQDGHWVELDSLDQPIHHSRDPAELASRLNASLGPRNLRFRFGELPVPRSRAGSFNAGGTAALGARSWAGAFGRGADLTMPPSPTEPRMNGANPYGPDSAYGAYGSTNPLRGGLHVGAGGNYGYGMGAQRPAFGSYGRPSFRLFRPER